MKNLKQAADYYVGDFLLNGKKRSKNLTKILKRIYMVQTVIMMLLFSAVPILASSDIGNVDAGDLMGKVIGIIIYLFFWVGLCVLIWGIVMFLLALKRQDGESKADAVQTMVAGIALMALRFLVDSLGLGVEIVMPE
ncbi:MAG TPA: hypothetical protein IAA06_00150 [Candidatus Blautia faecavium]|uniref:Uncharacterized protein n=1 Tax=Candidatus Blautia faecavium TaxID=2838487 RepID=A0A9D2RV10_9FIRM|nr:hypothetical protein [Candidatus Blautia faecavium]